MKTGKMDTLSRLSVADAMRRQVLQRPESSSIGSAINMLLKYKVNALLVIDGRGQPAGVVSKTDIMGAYYAGLPLEAPVEMIMSGPPLYCRPPMPLSEALEIMHAKGVYRLYVREADDMPVSGVLAYPDIVGLLYQICRHCPVSLHQRAGRSQADTVKRYTVQEVMTREVQSVDAGTSLFGVMEKLSAYRFGALLITEKDHQPVGVISKTDLSLAYRHGVDPQVSAREIMTPKVVSCAADEALELAIRRLIYQDVHRLFVHGRDPQEIIGVLSLSDAARVRSGSCHACVTSRIRLESAH